MVEPGWGVPATSLSNLEREISGIIYREIFADFALANSGLVWHGCIFTRTKRETNYIRLTFYKEQVGTNVDYNHLDATLPYKIIYNTRNTASTILVYLILNGNGKMTVKWM